jgi:two-component system NtrC family response regulator
MHRGVTGRKILIVDDDKTCVQLIESALQGEFSVRSTRNPKTALAFTQEWNPTVILTEIDFPRPDSTDRHSGIALLENLQRHAVSSKVIVITNCKERAYATMAISLGIHDFLFKPLDLDLLMSLTRRACFIWGLEQERSLYPAPSPQEFEEMIGGSESIRRIFSAIRKVATNDLPVLITGESGTGKEVTAKAIHERSARKNGPFVAINCGAIPETLVESALFGHERGAFTGAVQQQKGKVEAAQEGVLFLDEVGELSLTVQVKLLRFLQDQMVERVGGHRPIKLDVRIIAATNVDLKEAIALGNFREDLFYRLGVVHLHLPPLRERGEDVLLIATRLLRQISQQLRRRVNGYTKEAIKAIQDYPWPGNVRELTNKIRRAVVMTESLSLTPQDLDLPVEFVVEMPLPAPSLKEVRERAEENHLVSTLAHHQGNLTRVAQELRVSRPTLYRLLEKYQLLGRHAPDPPEDKG